MYSNHACDFLKDETRQHGNAATRSYVLLSHALIFNLNYVYNRFEARVHDGIGWPRAAAILSILSACVVFPICQLNILKHSCITPLKIDIHLLFVSSFIKRGDIPQIQLHTIARDPGGSSPTSLSRRPLRVRKTSLFPPQDRALADQGSGRGAGRGGAGPDSAARRRHDDAQLRV